MHAICKWNIIPKIARHQKFKTIKDTEKGHMDIIIHDAFRTPPPVARSHSQLLLSLWTEPASQTKLYEIVAIK